MTLSDLLAKFKLLVAPTRKTMLALFTDKIDIPTSPQTLAFLFQADKFCKTMQEKSAFSVLIQFAERGGVLIGFPNLSCPLVAYQLGLRILDPARINQSSFGLCGPTAFAVDILRSDPLEFIKCAVQLASTGRGKLRGLDISPGSDVRNYTPPRGGIPQADFLVLAGVRSSDEVLVATTDTGKYGGTGGAALFDWCVSCGYERVLLITCPVDAFFEPTNPLGSLKSLARNVLPGMAQTLGLHKTHILRSHPDGAGVFGIEGIDVTRKLEVLKLIPFFLGMGWKVFMQGEARIATAAQKFDEISALNVRNTHEFAQLGVPYAAKDAEHDSLQEMAGRGPEPHWMLLENLWIYPNYDKVGLSVHSWGKNQVHPGIPMDNFISNFGGMIVCSPLPAPVLPARRHRSGSTVLGPVLPPAKVARARSSSFS
jgi:hypothetical protein